MYAQTSGLQSARALLLPDTIPANCMTLERDKGHVAVHLRCLEALLQRQNRGLSPVPGIGLPIGDIRRWLPEPCVPCSHQGHVSLRAEPQNFVQSTSKSKREVPRNLPPHKTPVITGARMFGGAESIWDRIWAILRIEGL